MPKHKDNRLNNYSDLDLDIEETDWKYLMFCEMVTKFAGIFEVNES
jgi:hypothetical protein